MTMFNIWSGSELPDSLAENIIASHDILRPDDRHILISDSKVFCCEQIPYQDYKNLILKDDKYGRCFIDWMVKNTHYRWHSEAVSESDFIRFYFAANNERSIYSDCDNRVLKPVFDFDESRSWFAKKRDALDIFFFVDNGISKNIMESLLPCGPAKQWSVGAQAVTVINSSEDVRGISEDFFVHGNE